MKESSQGRIPRNVHPTHMSWGGGHTNTFLRAVGAGAATTEPSLRIVCEFGDEFGRIDSARLTANDAGLASAVSCGLKWTIVHEAAASIPGIAEFAQAALNCDAREGIGELECINLAVASFTHLLKKYKCTDFIFNVCLRFAKGL